MAMNALIELRIVQVGQDNTASGSRQWRFVQPLGGEKYSDLKALAERLVYNNCAVDSAVKGLRSDAVEFSIRQYSKEFDCFVDLVNNEIYKDRQCFPLRFEVNATFSKKQKPVDQRPHRPTPTTPMLNDLLQPPICKPEPALPVITNSQSASYAEPQNSRSPGCSSGAMDDAVVINDGFAMPRGDLDSQDQFNLMEILHLCDDGTDPRLKALENILLGGHPLPENMVKTAAQVYGKWLVFTSGSHDWKPASEDLKKMARTLGATFPNMGSEDFWYRERPCAGKLFNVVKNTRCRDERIAPRPYRRERPNSSRYTDTANPNRNNVLDTLFSNDSSMMNSANMTFDPSESHASSSPPNTPEDSGYCVIETMTERGAGGGDMEDMA